MSDKIILVTIDKGDSYGFDREQWLKNGRIDTFADITMSLTINDVVVYECDDAQAAYEIWDGDEGEPELVDGPNFTGALHTDVMDKWQALTGLDIGDYYKNRDCFLQDVFFAGEGEFTLQEFLDNLEKENRKLATTIVAATNLYKISDDDMEVSKSAISRLMAFADMDKVLK